MRAHLENLRAFVKHDMAFHREVVAASGNSIFIWFIEMAQKALTKGQIVHSHSINLRDLVADHEKIVGTVRQGDAERARREMLNHLTLARAYADQQGHVELRVFSPAAAR
jgi:DNA-binding FadR family transcriptional regulator